MSNKNNQNTSNSSSRVDLPYHYGPELKQIVPKSEKGSLIKKLFGGKK